MRNLLVLTTMQFFQVQVTVMSTPHEVRQVRSCPRSLVPRRWLLGLVVPLQPKTNAWPRNPARPCGQPHRMIETRPAVPPESMPLQIGQIMEATALEMSHRETGSSLPNGSQWTIPDTVRQEQLVMLLVVFTFFDEFQLMAPDVMELEWYSGWKDGSSFCHWLMSQTMHCAHVLQFAEVWQRSLQSSCNSSAQRFVNFYSHPHPLFFIDNRASPNLKIKQKHKNKTTVYLPLFCLMETMQIFFGKWWFTSFKALLQTRRRANRLHTTVCSEVLFRPLCFDYSVYSCLIINSRMDKTRHSIFFNNMSLTNSCLASLYGPFTPPV